MGNNYNICDISKETLTYLAYFDSDMIKKIPNYLIAKLCDLSADSELDFYIDKNKKFEDQDISEESKDLIALIYYDYIADEDEKKIILDNWKHNEDDYQRKLKEKYKIDLKK